ncbi:rubredoxin-like domain-containing protein [Desulfocicer niacini]
MKKWKCIICGYIHEGDEPPESCPICKAPASKFILLKPGEENASPPGRKKSPAPRKAQTPPPPSNKEKIEELEMAIKAERRKKIRLFRIVDFVIAQMVKHHAHPVSVHIPNGVLPVAVLFFVAALLFNMDSLATAGFYNVVVVLVALPLVIAAGFVEWVKKYNSAMTIFFKIKIFAAFITLFSCFISLVWFMKDPSVLHSCYAWLFILINVAMVGAAGVAGFLGGKLVFKD